MPVKAIESLADFVKEMSELRTRGDRTRPLFWFRGHTDAAFGLEPTILRDEPGSAAQELFESYEQRMNLEFLRSGISLLPHGFELVDVYLLARHHGLPSRLLDWTANPLAALFQAVAARPDADGEVLAVHVGPELIFGRNSRHRRREALKWAPVYQDHEAVVETVRYLFRRGPRPEHPVVVPFLPNLHAGRMLAQDACFMLFMPGCVPLGTTESNLTRFRIPARRKATLSDELRSLGVSWSLLFPDIDHLAQDAAETFRASLRE